MAVIQSYRSAWTCFRSTPSSPRRRSRTDETIRSRPQTYACGIDGDASESARKSAGRWAWTWPLGPVHEGPGHGTDRCMLVEDVVTTGGSTIRALEALQAEGLEVCGVLAICDRLAGGAERIEQAAGAPYLALTTIDEVYPDHGESGNQQADSLGSSPGGELPV